MSVTESPRIGRTASVVGMAGAAVQLVYGLLAVLLPYPVIVEPPFEALWAVANVGMIAGIVAWLALDVSRPRALAAIGGGLAVLGHLTRIVVSIQFITGSTADLDPLIIGSIQLMFLGMILLAIGTLRGRRLSGWPAWAPLLTVATGVVTASFYPVDKIVHFVLLGLLWGSAWMLMDVLAFRRSRPRHRVALLGT